MARALRQDGRVDELGDKRTIRAGHLNDGVAMSSGNEVTIYSRQVPADKRYAHGAGSSARQQGRDNFIYADLQGTGTEEDINGELLAVITDSEQRHTEAEYVIDDLENLREAAADERTERPQQPAVVPLAGEDKHIELRVRADPDSDGAVLDRDASSVKLYFTDIRA